jgi:hypothetical protein
MGNVRDKSDSAARTALRVPMTAHMICEGVAMGDSGPVIAPGDAPAMSEEEGRG